MEYAEFCWELISLAFLLFQILLYSYWVHICYTTVHVAIVFVIPAGVLISGKRILPPFHIILL